MLYLDYAATTPTHDEVLKSYYEILSKYFYNADSVYDKGIEVNRLMEKSRSLVAQMLGTLDKEIIFTSCGSESNNLAIKGAAFRYQTRGKHLITSCVEHSSVDESFKQLEEIHGFEVTYLPVNQFGCVDAEDLKGALRDDTILVSIMYVNNEIGSINDIEALSSIIKENSRALFHVDMVQALGKLPLHLDKVDLASFSSHKIHGLKGSGFLYKHEKISIVPLISGGQQEFGLRGGTSNACTNIVLAKTLRLALHDFDLKCKKINEINLYCRQLLLEIDDVVINSHVDYSIDSIINFSCVGYKPEVLLHDLESKGVYVSTRSACSSKTDNISRVMKALKLEDTIASSALRISLSSDTSTEDINEFIYCLKSSLENIKKQR